MAFRLRKTAALYSLWLSLLSPAHLAHAQARFDLPGPKLDIRVTRAGVTLPIASVPNLQANDQIWLHPDLPASQSVHYLLIAAFLRGTTNPPPDSWFIRVETWQKRVREEGVVVTVPPEAQQAVLFLAPETGGDFTTLRSAVKGRPGIFVRASQDLNEAGFEQARIEKYLAEMKRVPAGDQAALADHSNLLARTLQLKPNPDCFKRPLDTQYACLTQTGNQTLLDDGHSQSIAAALANGPSSDLINQASYTQLAGAGVYSAYVGAIVDLVRLTSGLHTAHYQYIPAVTFPAEDGRGETLALRLNTAPSFNNPKSVIVIGLPAVQASVLPPLRPVDPAHISCLLNPSVVLPVDGAPLVFSTAFAHDIFLHLGPPHAERMASKQLQNAQIKTASLDSEDSSYVRLAPDAFLGGLALTSATPDRRELPLTSAASFTPDPKAPDKGPMPAPASPGQPLTATIEGMWGFDRFVGPTVAVQLTPGANWHIVSSSDRQPADDLIAGQPNKLQLMATGTACVQSVALEPGETHVEWKLAAQAPPATTIGAGSASPPLPRPVDVRLNLQHAATPGSIQFAIQQFGQKSQDHLGARSFAEPAHVTGLRLHSGDTTLELTGSSLDQVKSLSLAVMKDTVNFIPSSCPGPPADASCLTSGGSVTFTMPLGTAPPSVKPGERLSATAHLADGRVLALTSTVLPPRPSLLLLSSHVTSPDASSIQLASSSDLPLGSLLTFFLKSAAPFPRAEQVEIASQDDSLHTILSIAAGTLILQDAHTVLATFDPLKIFGPSTFGPFRLRAITPSSGDAVSIQGAWVPLTTIVRLPTLTAIHCPAAPAAACTLSGSALYLIDSISATSDFAAYSTVPEGFVDASLEIPHPLNSVPVAGPGAASVPSLYIRLRDDPGTPYAVDVPIQTETPAPAISHPGLRPKGATPPRAVSGATHLR